MEKSSNKRVTIFAIILSLAAVGVLVFGFMMVSSSKVVMLQSISNLYGKFTNITDDEAALLDKLSQTDNVGLRGNLDLTIGKNKFTVNYDYLENKKDSKSNLAIDVKKEKKELFNGNVLFQDNNLYLFLKDITPNYYKLVSEYVSILKSINSDDYEKLISLLKDSVDSSIKNDDILKEKAIINYNGKDKKVTKLTYVVTNKKIEEIMTKLIKSIKADKTLFNDITNYLGISKKDLQKQLDNELELIKTTKEQEIFRYQIYYYGFNRIVQYELYNKDLNLLLKYKVDNEEYITLTINDTNYFDITISKDNKTYSFNGKVFDTYDFNGTLSENLLELIFKLDKEYKLDVLFSDDISDNNFKSLYQITFYDKSNEKEKKLFLIDANLEYYFGEKIESDVDISTATLLDEETIDSLLQTNLGISLEELKEKYSNSIIQ